MQGGRERTGDRGAWFESLYVFNCFTRIWIVARRARFPIDCTE
jgi:hypothetical protein